MDLLEIGGISMKAMDNNFKDLLLDQSERLKALHRKCLLTTADDPYSPELARIGSL